MGRGLEKSRGGNPAEEGRGVALLEVVEYRWRTRIHCNLKIHYNVLDTQP